MNYGRDAAEAKIPINIFAFSQRVRFAVPEDNGVDVEIPTTRNTATTQTDAAKILRKRYSDPIRLSELTERAKQNPQKFMKLMKLMLNQVRQTTTTTQGYSDAGGPSTDPGSGYFDPIENPDQEQGFYSRIRDSITQAVKGWSERFMFWMLTLFLWFKQMIGE